MGSCLAERNYFFSSCKWFFTGNFFYFDIVCGIREKNFERIFFCFVYLPPVSPWASTSAVISRRYRKINEIEFNYGARWPLYIRLWLAYYYVEYFIQRGEKPVIISTGAFYKYIFIFNATNKRPRNKKRGRHVVVRVMYSSVATPCCPLSWFLLFE